MIIPDAFDLHAGQPRVLRFDHALVEQTRSEQRPHRLLGLHLVEFVRVPARAKARAHHEHQLGGDEREPRRGDALGEAVAEQQVDLEPPRPGLGSAVGATG
ncbi:MAG: hypothetical protein IPJ65_43310 [Archangiaceae bacterium]|nr:hypothetical protein [Archangiaceae bacterium]